MIISVNQASEFRVHFARKSCNLDEVLEAVTTDKTGSCVVIVQQKEMTIAEYDEFASALLIDRDWLPGSATTISSGLRGVIEVRAPERQSLYVDPSGYRYARYVGLRIE